MSDALARTLAVQRTDDTLRERVRLRLREAIFDGHLKPGQRLVERELTELTGVSRSVLREALAHLEAQGLVVREAFRGYAVTRLSEQKIREIYELRSSLEALAAELFTARASDAEVAALGAAGSELQDAVLAGDLTRIRIATTRYYDILLDGCGNSEIRRALAAVADRIVYLRGRSISSPERQRASAVEMADLTRALCRRDAAAAEAATKRHVEAARDSALARAAGP